MTIVFNNCNSVKKTEFNPTNDHLWLMRTPNWAAHGISDQKYEDQLLGKQ